MTILIIHMIVARILKILEDTVSSSSLKNISRSTHIAFIFSYLNSDRETLSILNEYIDCIHRQILRHIFL